jgi:deoxycytidylate deaminase
MKTRFFDLAKRAARQSNSRYLMGAVVVKGRYVVSWGCNKSKTHPKSSNPWRTVHAELDAVIGVPDDRLRGSDLYIVRVTRSGQVSMSRPCAYCWSLLQAAGVKRVYYSDKKGKYHKEVL